MVLAFYPLHVNKSATGLGITLLGKPFGVLNIVRLKSILEEEEKREEGFV